MGYAVIEESAREIIRERRLNGQIPRPEPQEFVAELLRRDRAKYEDSALGPSPAFFDRCLIESVAMARESGVLSESEVTVMLGTAHFHGRVFILPPWKEIYTNDPERDHTFEHCERVHKGLSGWYAACGYELHEVPRATPRQRAQHVLRALSESGA